MDNIRTMEKTIELAALYGTHMPKILKEISLFLPMEKRRSDPFENMDKVINEFSEGTVAQRLARRGFMYIKRQYAILRHTPQQLENKHFRDGIEWLMDIEVSVSEINPSHKELGCLLMRFITDYVALCHKYKIDIGVLRDDPRVPEDPAPPQGGNILWYKSRGYATFLKDKAITFLGGTFPNQPCRILRYNKNNTRCVFSDGSTHFISVNVPLHFENRNQ